MGPAPGSNYTQNASVVPAEEPAVLPEPELEAGPADAICRALGEYIINPTSNVSAEELAWIIAEFQRTEFELDTWHRERQAVLDDVAIIVEAPVQVKQKFAKFVSLHALLQHVEDEGESG